MTKLTKRARRALVVYVGLCVTIGCVSVLFALQRESDDERDERSVEVVELQGEPWLRYQMGETFWLLRFSAVTSFQGKPTGRHSVTVGSRTLENNVELGAVQKALREYEQSKSATGKDDR